jgi:hypothetical protein
MQTLQNLILFLDDVIKRIERNGFYGTLSQENKLPIVIFDMNKQGNLLKICEGKHRNCSKYISP